MADGVCIRGLKVMLAEAYSTSGLFPMAKNDGAELRYFLHAFEPPLHVLLFYLKSGQSTSP